MRDWEKFAELKRQFAEEEKLREDLARKREEVENEPAVMKAYIAHLYDHILPTPAAEAFHIGGKGNQTGWVAPHRQTITSETFGDSLEVTGGDWRDRYFSFVWKNSDGTIVKHFLIEELDPRGDGRSPLAGVATYFVSCPTSDDEIHALSRFLNVPGWQFGKTGTTLLRYKPRFQGPGREVSREFLQEREAFLNNIIASRR